MFENRVLRRMFGPMWDEVTREWRRLHNKGLHNLYSSQFNIRILKLRRMTKIARMGDRRGAYRILVWRPEGERPLGRHKAYMESMGLRETERNGADWIDLAQDRAPTNMATNLRAP
jgi:hypothetical protein